MANIAHRSNQKISPPQDQFLSQILIILEQEIVLYQRYIDRLQKERKAVVACDTVSIEQHAGERGLILDALAQLNTRRIAIIKESCGRLRGRLSDYIREHYSIDESRGVLEKIEIVRELSILVKSENQQHHQLVGFGQRLVEGTISLLCSASQTVNRVYSRSGKLIENIIPREGQARLKLREA